MNTVHIQSRINQIGAGKNKKKKGFSYTVHCELTILT